jgi:hypothetical protein
MGTTFDVDIRADISNPVVGFGIDLSFDASVLSQTVPPTVDPTWFAIAAPDGDGLAGAAFPTPIFGTDVSLATMHFTAISPGMSALTLGATPGDLTEGFPLFPSGFDTASFQSGWVVVAPDYSVNLPVSFSVDGGRFNGARPTSNEAEGLIPAPNDVYSFGPNGLNLATEGEIFASPMDGSNTNRIPGALGASLGLVANDNVTSLSYGRDGGNAIHLSVDSDAVGVAGSAVFAQAAANEAAGDIFLSKPRDDIFGSYITPSAATGSAGSNTLEFDESLMGLQAPGPGAFGTAEDDLDALEMTSPNEVDGNQDGFVDSNSSKNIFFTLDEYSPSVIGGLAEANDILVVTDNTMAFVVYADGELDIQLDAGDKIDALVLSDVLQLSVLDAGDDEALFSLTADSDSVVSGSANAGDIYYTDFLRAFDPTLDYLLGGSLWATAASIGLLAGDELNGLDVSSVPEPSTGLLVAMGLIALSASRRRERTGRTDR